MTRGARSMMGASTSALLRRRRERRGGFVGLAELIELRDLPRDRRPDFFFLGIATVR